MRRLWSIAFVLLYGCGSSRITEVPFDRDHQLLISFAPGVLVREKVCYECYPTYETPIDSCAKYLDAKRVLIDSSTIRDHAVLETLVDHGAAYMAAYWGFPACRDLDKVDQTLFWVQMPQHVNVEQLADRLRTMKLPGIVHVSYYHEPDIDLGQGQFRGTLLAREAFASRRKNPNRIAHRLYY